MVAEADTVEGVSLVLGVSVSREFWWLVSYKAIPVMLERSVDHRGLVYWATAVTTTVSRIGSDF